MAEYRYTGGGISDAEKRALVKRDRPRRAEDRESTSDRLRTIERDYNQMLGDPQLRGVDVDELMRRATRGSKPYSKKEIKQGYRHHGKC